MKPPEFFLVSALLYFSPAGGRGADLQSFHYVITATGTSNLVTYPGQQFTYSVTGTGTETWSELVDTNRNLSFVVRNDEFGTTGQNFTFVPPLAGDASVRYDLVGKPGSLGSQGVASSMSLEVDGRTICSAFTGSEGRNVSGTCPFDAVAGKTYTLHLLTAGELGDGRASATVRLPDHVSVTFTAQRTAQDTRSATVSAADGEKEIAPISVNAFPQPEKGGQISGVTYSVTDDSASVTTRIQNLAVFATTSYSQTQRMAWTAMESGDATVSTNNGSKFIAQSSLAAPNADTLWTVTNNNPQVETWMTGNQLFARVVLSNPPQFHSADFQDPRWVINDTEINRVLSYWRAGAYHTNAAGLDGFAAGSGPTGGSRHSADFRAPFWQIDDTELNRALAYWRAGAYHADPQGADGYAPGAQSSAGILPAAGSVSTVSNKGIFAPALPNNSNTKLPQ